MRRVARVVAVIVSGLAIGGGAAFALGAGDDDGGGGSYLVRAVFNNASFLISGEDVKVDGNKVGKIKSLELTRNNKAAVVLNITDPQFQPFHQGASCRVGLQSLIGEQFVQCQPTGLHTPGETAPPPLPTIRSGPGKGQHLITAAHTSSPVGVDLLNNIMRLPERQRFRLILGELGVGLSGNGAELRAALRHADPALQQLDDVIRVLAGQNKLLARLVDESDKDLAPLARQRRHFGGFIDHAGAVGEATAERGRDLEADIAKFPGFLHQLIPAARRFTLLADQMAPALNALHERAPEINATVKRFGPMLKYAGPALVSLGDAAAQGRKTFPKAYPLAKRLKRLGPPLLSTAVSLANLTRSFDVTGGIEALMRFIYYYSGVVNGEDKLGHYVRGLADINACVVRTTTPTSCPANFAKRKSFYTKKPPRGQAGWKPRGTSSASAKSAGAEGLSASAAERTLDYLLGSGGGK